ncbi:MAG: FeoB-associated Cys-rich membrane protein [Desulfovibrio sp.]|nr:FeoB-associated Cys-rich membrane protein [Desulfovibrio sp.]
MTLDNLLVILIVCAAIFFFARRIYTNLKRGSCDCGCGCGKNCKSKPRIIK